jgi:hypothetical protein
VTFEEWFENLVGYALVTQPLTLAYIQKYPFMYEDYFEAGQTPEEAFHAEWG